MHMHDAYARLPVCNSNVHTLTLTHTTNTHSHVSQAMHADDHARRAILGAQGVQLLGLHDRNNQDFQRALRTLCCGAQRGITEFGI